MAVVLRLVAVHDEAVEQPVDCTIEDDASDATAGDVVVVIDVIRAFTTAATALAHGATEIRCVDHVEPARALAAADSTAVLSGEEQGRFPAGFDLWNSPSACTAERVGGRPMVFVTVNGTVHLVRAAGAGAVLAAAAVNASATAAWLRRNAGGRRVRLVTTGRTSEDAACAQYIADLASGGPATIASLDAAIGKGVQEHLELWEGPRDDVPRFLIDAELCARVNRYDFAVVGDVAWLS
ncbi:MAG: 2-phosphosulfolactate phosphatase [Acidimicrobiales bacterium]